MGSLGGEAVSKELFVSSSSDPLVIELTRLENLLMDKDRELGLARKDIKVLKQNETLKDKALLELTNESKRMDDKMRSSVGQLEQKNLEINRLVNEKKEALASQFSAEATLRRVYASKKDEKFVPVEVLIAPYVSDIKKCQNEIAALKEDKKVLERLMKSKEEALVKADNMVSNALERAMFVDTLQNQNLELKRQLEICQDENKLLKKRNRQKVIEVEKLAQTICNLEESILAGGEAANAARHYQYQVSKLNEDKRSLERELARANVLANRVAKVIANEWKDDDEKVMPVKQWLQERRFLQAEIQRLRDNLAIAERTVKAEVQLTEKISLRLKALEEGLKHESRYSGNKVENSKLQSNRIRNKPLTSQIPDKHSTLEFTKSHSEGADKLKTMNSRGNLNPELITVKNNEEKNQLDRKNKLLDISGKENTGMNVQQNGHIDDFITGATEDSLETNMKNIEDVKKNSPEIECEDTVSGFLYDRLQKELINSRKINIEKDGLLDNKDDEIKLLQRRIESQNKAMEVKLKKTRGD